MDSEFYRRWRENVAPFDGRVVTLAEFAPVPYLREALPKVIACLYDSHPKSQLFRLDDWHEHDGFMTRASPSSWEELQGLVASDEALLWVFHLGDTCVRAAFFPYERDFYLRFYLSDPDENGRLPNGDRDPLYYGIFDIACADSQAAEIFDALKAVGVASVLTVAAKMYFDENAA